MLFKKSSETKSDESTTGVWTVLKVLRQRSTIPVIIKWMKFLSAVDTWEENERQS